MTIDNLDEAVLARLQSQAEQNGRSVEAEIRAILTDAVISKDRFANFAIKMRHQAAEGGYWSDSVADLRADRDR